jgi:hypothetical protein
MAGHATVGRVPAVVVYLLAWSAFVVLGALAIAVLRRRGSG